MNTIESNVCIYNTQMGYGLPLSGTTTVETLIPIYGSVVADSMPQQKIPIKSESGLTYNVPLPRKRPRESSTLINPLLSYQPLKNSTPLSFLGQDLSLHIQHQQLDIEHLISQHMEKVRVEIEEERKRQARRIIDAIEEGMMKRLKAKEEEIEKIGRLNSALEERVKSLCMENHIWRELAQTNEATANALRTNLEQVLAATALVKHGGGAGLDDAAAEVMEDAQSCCGSNGGCGGEEEDEEEEEAEKYRLTLTQTAQDKGTSRMCRNCGKEGSCVLLLPCRHLCLCNVCGSNLHTCPVCKSIKNASVHVNMS